MLSKSRGEYLMFEYLELLFPDKAPFDNCRYSWLANPVTGQHLEIDRYYPELRVGFEFQGEQHFRQVNGMGDYKHIVYLDKLKKRLCKQSKVLLVAIRPIDLRSTEIKSIGKKVSSFTGVKRYRYDARCVA